MAQWVKKANSGSVLKSGVLGEMYRGLMTIFNQNKAAEECLQ